MSREASRHIVCLATDYIEILKNESCKQILMTTNT